MIKPIISPKTMIILGTCCFFSLSFLLSWIQRFFSQYKDKNPSSKISCGHPLSKNTKENNYPGEKDLWILVGLGNPGKEYENTRHNAGILLVEALKNTWDFPEFRQKGQVKWTQGFVEGKKVILAYPTTYMNLSGQGLAPFIKLQNKGHWVVLHDDLDLPSGDIRFKEGGGHGGHNGLRSLEGILPNPYKRLRLGIGRPQEKHQVSNYVLNNFSKEQWESFQKSAENLLILLPLLFQGKKDIFTQQLHGGKNIEKK